jgi:HD-GYP domain-containing protein (c-di-GMP phosphodiesterase class II)
MTPAKYWIRISVLRSKVARRMFLLFVLCALLPLGVLALLSFFEVRTHLNSLSERRLHQASKSAGMTIVERVSFLETDLNLISVSLLSHQIESLEHPGRTLGDRIGKRFLNLAVLAGDDRVVSSLNGLAAVCPRLTNEERRHVRSGGTLVTTTPRRDGTHAIFVAMPFDPAAPDGGTLIGEVNPDYLWGGEGFISPSIELCVIGQAGETLFASLADGVPSRQLAEAVAEGGPTGRFEWSHGDERYVAGYWTLFMRPTYLTSWVLVQSEQRIDVQAPLQKFAWTFSLIVLCTFWVVTFASLNQIRRRMVPIEQLLEATNKLKAKEFSHRVRIDTNDEFADLGASFNEMTESMDVHLSVMTTINSIGVSLSAEKDEARLLETVLRGAQAVFNADGAALYLLSKDDRLELSLAHVTSLSLWLRGSGARDPRDLEDARAHDAYAMLAAAGATERTMSTPDVYAADSHDFAPLIEFDRRMSYRSRSFVSVPLRNHENEVIGILQLINAQARTTGESVPFSDDDQRLAESLASQAAVALTKNRLVHDFKGLFEGLTEVISTAIDEQSPYTGGHVRRVVVLSMMIAEAMSRSTKSASTIRALSEEELYELRIAALLHDCGKLTTPVHITDKATKLESIVDRIRLVEARAEIARRQRRVELLEEAVQRLAPGGDRELIAGIEGTAADYDVQLEEDLAVLRKCNEGTEYMPESQRERIREIGCRYSWINTRGERESLLSEDEMYHLSTRSGTLTTEEREIIKGHVASSIRMLERLPYPKKLRNIPKYAGTHHERMDGTGYPLKLSSEDIPLQGRIIGIADRLEALTARDRPYKRALSLADAMDVLREMAQQGAIDGDLYDLVVSERIHQRYADEYL